MDHQSYQIDISMKPTNCFLILLIFAIGLSPVSAQQSDPIPALLIPLASTDVQVRATGFYSLVGFSPAALGEAGGNEITLGVEGLLTKYPTDASKIIAALNQLLVTENADTTRGSLASSAEDESPGDFYGDVVEAVVSLNNTSSIPALAGAISTGGMATTALSKFGKASLPSVLPLVYSPNVQVRDSAALVLINLSNSLSVGDTFSQSEIRAGLQRAISSFAPPSPYQPWTTQYKAALASMPSVPTGDLNGDGLVNCADLAIIKASFGRSVGQTGFDIRADVNGDGVVNILDLSAEANLLPAGTKCQ